MLKIIIGHFLVGFLCAMGVVITDLRGAEYDENYFGDDGGFVFLILIAFGYFTPLLFLIIYGCLRWNEYGGDKMLTRIIYNIANIGVKKDDKES